IGTPDRLSVSSLLQRATGFAARFGLKVPIFLAPMAGVPSPALSIAVAEAGGAGACGVLPLQPQEIHAWVKQVRAGTNGPFQLNNWIPDAVPEGDPEELAQI